MFDLSSASAALVAGNRVKAKFLAIRAIGALDIEGASEYAEEAKRGDATTAVALAGYLRQYAGPWGLKASEEDALVGIIDAVWPSWCKGDMGAGIRKLRADRLLPAIADELADDCGETDALPLVERTVASLRLLIPPEQAS